MKRIVAFLLTISTTFSMIISISGASAYYSDVSDDAWYSDAVDTVTPFYMNGYEDETFRPENNVTRAEAAKILQNLELDKLYGGDTYFTDVEYGTWYHYAACTDGAYIGGTNIRADSNSHIGYIAYFYPHEYITREDFAVGIFNRLLAAGYDIWDAAYPETSYMDREQITLTDPDNQYPYERAFAVLNHFGVMTGNPDGTINPKGLLTRAEMAQIISNLATETGLLIGNPDLRL